MRGGSAARQRRHPAATCNRAPLDRRDRSRLGERQPDGRRLGAIAAALPHRTDRGAAPSHRREYRGHPRAGLHHRSHDTAARTRTRAHAEWRARPRCRDLRQRRLERRGRASHARRRWPPVFLQRPRLRRRCGQLLAAREGRADRRSHGRTHLHALAGGRRPPVDRRPRRPRRVRRAAAGGRGLLRNGESGDGHRDRARGRRRGEHRSRVFQP